MKAKQGKIRLTEQELHYLVEDAVRTYLINEGMDEGVWGGLKTMGQRAYNKMTGNGNYSSPEGETAPQEQPQGNIFNRMGKSLDKFGNSVTNAGRTFQMGSANQDAQKAITNAVNALNNLKTASQKMQQAGGGGLQGKALQAVDTALKYLTMKGGAGMSSVFQQTANAAGRGGTFQNW